MAVTEPKGPAAFHVMTKPIGPVCNLNCTYCFYLEKEKLYPDQSHWKMPQEVLESYIKQYIEAHRVPEVTFAWQGGEPTILGVNYFREIIRLQQKYAQGKTIHNALQTNGTLLDDNWATFLKDNHFLVGVSIDGTEKMHDKFRVDKGDRPTFHKVMHGIDVLKKHDVDFNTLTVVQRHNGHYPKEVYRFLKDIGSGYIQFIPIVERIAESEDTQDLLLVSPETPKEARLAPWSVEPLQFGRFLSSVFDDWVRADVGRIFVQIFDVALEAWMGYNPSLCVFRETCGEGLALEHNGDLYSCDHYVYEENRLGNIINDPLMSMVASEQQIKFGQDKRDALPRQCRECDVYFACHGECPKHRFMTTQDGEKGLSYLCEGYKHFFHHIDPYMRIMARELRANRAPANIMHYLRQEEAEKKNPKKGKITAVGSNGRGLPNSPCPCGSGRKYKKCCGRNT